MQIKEFRFCDFKIHINPEAARFKLNMASSVGVLRPTSGEMDRVKIVLSIGCESDDPEDFYLKMLVHGEVLCDKDFDDNEVVAECLPILVDELRTKANRIANEMNLPEFDFLTVNNILQSRSN